MRKEREGEVKRNESERECVKKREGEEKRIGEKRGKVEKWK